MEKMLSYKEFLLEEVSGNITKFNAGDVAEGIFILACVARFMKRDSDIVLQDIKDIMKTVTAAAGRTTNDTVMATWQAPNENPHIKDEINLTIRLAKSNLDALFSPDIFSNKRIKPITDAALHYVNDANLKSTAMLFYTNNQVNVMDFVADGIGNQTGTKQDVYVKVSGPNGKTELNLSVSLKAGVVKQFGQIGGAEPAKQEVLWDLFGFTIPPSVMKKYTEFYAAGDINSAIKYSYEELAQAISGEPGYNDSSEKTSGKTLKSAIVHFMIGTEDIELVHLNKVSKVYNPKTLVFPNKIVAVVKSDGKYPQVLITSKDASGKVVDLLRIRMKLESKTQYVRNYIEKGADLYDMQVNSK
jgi:hypothetical protein